MFNTFQFNRSVFNGSGQLVPVLPSTPIVFNNFSLQDSDIVTQFLIQDNTPERDFLTSPTPRGDGGIITGDFWRQKTISVSGVIHKDTNAELEAELDAMKKALAVTAGTLDITIAGSIRRYQATLVNGHMMFSDRKNYHITFCPFQADFLTLEPFGYSPLYESDEFNGTTDLSLDSEFNNNGTVRAKPIVMIVFTAVSAVTAVSFKNNTTGEEIKLTTGVSAGDYIKFDSEALEVTLNGVIQDYSGAFPRLDTGGNLFTLTVTGVSATYDLTIKYKIPYL